MTKISSFPSINDRICIKNQYATIRYIGPLYPAKAETSKSDIPESLEFLSSSTTKPIDDIWIGLEWDNSDDQCRLGQHSGSYQGKSYFITKNVNSGSFIKLSKLLPYIHEKISFNEAFNKKYVFTESKNGLDLDSFNDDITRSQLLEYLKKLRVISLTKSHISWFMKDNNWTFENAENTKFIAKSGISIIELSPHLFVEELDLSYTFLTDWKHLFEILNLFNHSLKTVDLSHNRFKPFESSSSNTFGHIKSLNLSDTMIDWLDVVQILSLTPSLDTLAYRSNYLSNEELEKSVTVFSSKFYHLKNLFLENNSLMSICYLFSGSSIFPNLEILNISNNPIKLLEYVDANAQSSIQTLYANNLLISEWTDILPLSKFTNLRRLHFRNDTFLMSDYNVQSRFVSFLPQLVELNGSLIDYRERRNLELHFLKSVATSIAENEKSLLPFSSVLNRLIQKYDFEMLPNSPSNLKSALRERMITNLSVIYYCPGPRKTTLKPIPKAMKLLQFKKYLNHLLGIPLDSSFFISQSNKVQEELSDDWKELDYFNLISGDNIIIRSSSDSYNL